VRCSEWRFRSLIDRTVEVTFECDNDANSGDTTTHPQDDDAWLGSVIMLHIHYYNYALKSFEVRIMCVVSNWLVGGVPR
jgi:hypothetical protein